MEVYSIPDRNERQYIESGAQAQSNLCWNCGTCDLECPVFRSNSPLRPQKIVRLATLGFIDELLTLPELWYCLTCRRCSQACPNLVQPASVIQFLRQEAIRRNLFTWEDFCRYRDVYNRFQRVRWNVAQQCFKGDVLNVSTEQWNTWLNTPVHISHEDILFSQQSPSSAFRDAVDQSSTTACFTCSQCTNTCPIFFERDVFDPQWIFRMVNLGLEEEILRSPSIWLCIGCQRCTDTCSELVAGHLIIQRLQELAQDQGFVDKGFLFRWNNAQKMLYRLFTEEVDALFGFQRLKRVGAL